jgi:hypothetical protein
MIYAENPVREIQAYLCLAGFQFICSFEFVCGKSLFAAKSAAQIDPNRWYPSLAKETCSPNRFKSLVPHRWQKRPPAQIDPNR